MTSMVEFKQVFLRKDALIILACSIDPLIPVIMTNALKLMTAMCLKPPNGHERALEAITICGEIEGRKTFAIIIQGLETQIETLRIACIQLINALVTSPYDLNFRLHLRNELMRTRLIDALKIGGNQRAELSVLLKVQDHKDEDEEFKSISQRHENITLEFENMIGCYELNRKTISKTPAESDFLSFIQHLLHLKNDVTAKLVYYRPVEECASQLVLHKNGRDPNFRRIKRFKIDIEPLIALYFCKKTAVTGVLLNIKGCYISGLGDKFETVTDNSKQEDERVSDELSKKLEEALAAKEESEAKLTQAEVRLRESKAKLTQAETRLREYETAFKDFQKSVCISSTNYGKFPQLPSGMSFSEGSIPSPLPLPPSSVMPPPPPPPSSGFAGLPPPALMTGSGPLFPPPMPEMGPSPPICPLPPSGMDGIRMPPPQMGGLFPNLPSSNVLPHGMQPKNKYVLETPLKRANWEKILPQKLSENSFWSSVHEEQLASEDIFEILSAKFTPKPQAKKENKFEDKMKPRKVKELKVLDSKSAQNLLIMLGLVKISAQDMQRYILRIDEDKLTDAILQQLIKNMSQSDQLSRLEQFKDQYNELAEAEQFALTLGSIKRLVPRLKSISFKMRFHELVQDIEPDIVAATAACEEVKQSKKFCLILQMILLVGNYMNAGSRNEQSVGFQLNFLTKLNSTKSVDYKTTLLHCLVEIIEKKHPDALNFAEELGHIDRATRASAEKIQINLNQMKRSVKELETDLENFRPHNEEDRFGEVMTGFLKEASEQYEILETMNKKLDKLYDDLSIYYVFDPKKYTSDEFFSNIKTFKDMFQEAYKDNLHARELRERMHRTLEAKGKAAKEKPERLTKSKPLKNMSSGENQEGIKNSLSETLETGQAFSHAIRRKNPARGAAERRIRSKSDILAHLRW